VKVGLDLLAIGARAAGIGRHGVELPGALLAVEPGVELTVIVSREAPEELTSAAWADDVRWLRVPVAATGRVRALAQYAAVPALGRARRLDLLHTPTNVGPPRVPGLPAVVTVHDFIWRYAGREWGPPEAIAAMERVAVRAARWATRVQADSRATRDDVIRFACVDPARVDVVPLGVRFDAGAPASSEAALRARFELGAGPVLLAVAQKRPYKNLTAVVRALAALGDDARLVIPGARTPYETELRALAAELGVAERVRFIDWVEEPDLEGLYRLAAAVLVLSRFEGFGLPVLEAMGRGAPVVCADAMSLPEVAGDAALLVDPADQPAIDAAVARVVGDPDLRADLARRGRLRASEFTWERTARETLASYRRALAR
jgi:glycosyltransferase involved in cell wall biosynthesis